MRTAYRIIGIPFFLFWMLYYFIIACKECSYYELERYIDDYWS